MVMICHVTSGNFRTTFHFFDEQLISNFNISWISMIFDSNTKRMNQFGLALNLSILHYRLWPFIWPQMTPKGQILVPVLYHHRVCTEKVTVKTPLMFLFIWVLQLYFENIKSAIFYKTRDGTMWSLNTWEQDDL